MVLYLFIYLFCFHIVSDFLCVVIIYSGFFLLLLHHLGVTQPRHRIATLCHTGKGGLAASHITLRHTGTPGPALPRPALTYLPYLHLATYT